MRDFRMMVDDKIHRIRPDDPEAADAWAEYAERTRQGYFIRDMEVVDPAVGGGPVSRRKRRRLPPADLQLPIDRSLFEGYGYSASPIAETLEAIGAFTCADALALGQHYLTFEGPYGIADPNIQVLGADRTRALSNVLLWATGYHLTDRSAEPKQLAYLYYDRIEDATPALGLLTSTAFPSYPSLDLLPGRRTIGELWAARAAGDQALAALVNHPEDVGRIGVLRDVFIGIEIGNVVAGFDQARGLLTQRTT